MCCSSKLDSFIRKLIHGGSQTNRMSKIYNSSLFETIETSLHTLITAYLKNDKPVKINSKVMAMLNNATKHLLHCNDITH